MSIDSNIGGYPVEWFVEPPSDNFKCGICFDVIKNPRQCKNGHTFCHSCISLALKTHKNCPACKVNLSSDTLSLNLLMRNEIDERFVVKCNHDNFQNGCEWTGTLEQSIEHFQKCPHRLIPCPLHAVRCCLNKNCTGKIKRQDLREHLFCGGSKRDIVDTMLIMAETIATQQKEIDLLQDLCLNKKARLEKLECGGVSFGVPSKHQKSIDGFCVVKDFNGPPYYGHFKDGDRSGFGVSRTNEVEYSGYWLNNRLSGHGMLRSLLTGKTPNRPFMNISIGNFDNSLRHGIVTDINASNTTIGSYKNGKLDGFVERIFDNGNKFIGNVSNNGSTSIYTGTYTSNNGDDVFVGTVDETMSYFVQGTLTSATNGIMYEGNFVDKSNMLRINGTGTITYTNGGIYTGEFRSGLRHGFGTFVNKHGFIRSGQWVNNKFTAQQPQEQELKPESGCICNKGENKTAAAVVNVLESGMSEKKSTFVAISDFFSHLFT